MTQPFLYPGAYSPGQFAFNNNPELSQLITMFGGPLMGAMAGPGNFMPHMQPGQAVMDQFAMRNYQMQTRQATYGVANYQNDELATRLLGVRSAFTDKKATDMNKEQAMQMANVLNNPMVKTVMGMAMGPENVEALLHGSRGDVQSLGSTINRIGYFRKGPDGSGRMNANALEDLTTGVFSHLYEPQGDVGKLGDQARAGGRAGATAISRLQEAADMKEKKIVSDAELQTRLQGLETGKVDDLYKKYVQGGTATDAATQAKELTRFDRAIAESKVLDEDEASIGQLQTRAKRRPTDEMHGFMAGQIGQMTENLFQRGMLPPSIGALDAASRVSAISETKLDDATIERLARKQAERDIVGKDDDYAARYSRMSDTEKKEEIDKVVGSYVTKIKDTKAEADKTAKGAAGAKSAEDVLQMVGGEALAGNVDASRTSSQIKQYTDSVKAIRDIFGDNGNPNAPMPALMAVLDQLTHGSMGSMKPAAVASTLRQMQTLARETGTGMQQLGAISAHAGSIGQQLGIAPSITMQNVANTLGMTKAAMDSGAFSTPVFGARGKEEFQVRATEMLQRGEASGNAKAMAALNRIYKMNRSKFDAGGGKPATELAAAMAAYNDPNSDGTYTFTDPNTGEKVTRNLYRDVGQGRGQAARALLQRSGGNDADFMAAVYDERTGEFQNAGKGFLTQKHERVNYLSQMIGEGTVSGRLKDKKSRKYTGALEGLNDPQVGAQLQRSLSNTLTGMVFESSHMNLEDQATYLQKHMKPKLIEHFKAQGHPDPEKAAEQVYQEFGADRGKLDRFVGNVGQAYQHAYGENMAAGAQMYSQGRDVSGVLEAGKALSRTESARRLMGYESTVGSRVSDYLLDIGERGEKFNAGELAKHMMRAGSDETFAKAYAGEMGAGMDVLGRRKKAASIKTEDVKAVATKAKAGDPTAAAELRKMAGVEDDTLVITQTEIDAARDAKFADESKGGMSTADLRAAWAKSHEGSTGEHLTREQLISDLKDDTQFNTQHAADYRSKRGADAGKTKVVTQDELEAMAIRRNVGKALKGKQGEHEDITAVQRAIDKGGDSAALASGFSAAGRVFDKALKESGVDTKQLKTLVESTGDSAQGDILKAFGLTKEKYDEALKQEDPSKTKEGRAAEAASAYLAMQAAKKYDKDKLGQAESSSPDGKQKVDKANIDATTVVVNADRIDGKGGTAAAPPTTAAPAGTTTAAAPAATTPPATDAAATGAGATQQPPAAGATAAPPASPPVTPPETGATPKPDQPLAKPDGTATPAADTAAAAEKASEAPPPTPAAEQPATDGQLPTIPSAKTDPAAAEAAAASDAAVARDLAYSPGDKPLEPVATTADTKTKEELERKTAAAAVAAAAGAEAAQAAVPEKADIDKDSLRATDESTYMGLPGGKVRTKDGQETKLESDTNRWDAMYTRDVAEDQKEKVSGRVAKLGDKHYEEYFDGTKKPQWREVNVGDIEGDQSVGDGSHRKTRTRDGLDALMDLDGIPGDMLGGSSLKDIQTHMIETGRVKPPAPVKESGPRFDMGFSGLLGQAVSMFGPKVEDTLQEGAAAREAARAAASIPAARTPSQTLNDQYNSANINPAASALQAPQQTSGTATAAAGGGSGSSDNCMTVTGRLTLEGLDAVLMEASGQRAVQTPNGGVPVVGDPPRSRVTGGGRQSTK